MDLNTYRISEIRIIFIRLNEDSMDNKNGFRIVTKGGTMRFGGEWFGRPYDNFHTISKVTYENNRITVTFNAGEEMEIIDPLEITNEEKVFAIKKASKVTWKYIPYGIDYSGHKEYVYESVGDGKVEKYYNGKKMDFTPTERMAVECLRY